MGQSVTAARAWTRDEEDALSRAMVELEEMGSGARFIEIGRRLNRSPKAVYMHWKRIRKAPVAETPAAPRVPADQTDAEIRACSQAFGMREPGAFA